MGRSHYLFMNKLFNSPNKRNGGIVQQVKVAQNKDESANGDFNFEEFLQTYTSSLSKQDSTKRDDMNTLSMDDDTNQPEGLENRGSDQIVILDKAPSNRHVNGTDRDHKNNDQ